MKKLTKTLACALCALGFLAALGSAPVAKAADDNIGSNVASIPVSSKLTAVDVESADPDSMLNLYRRVLALRHELQTTDLSLEWLPEDQPGKAHDGANGFPGGTIAYRRANGWASITNFGEEPITLPQGEVLLTSGPLTDDGKLPQDTSAWLKLAD